MQIGSLKLDNTVKRPIIMGILNLTPDSFSDGGRYTTPDKIKLRIEQMIEEGADIIDVGGESTRPGYIKISIEEEIERVCPTIELLSKEYHIPVSVDTYKHQVAKASLLAGAHMINDIWGLSYPEDTDHLMAKTVAKAKVPVCIMHNAPEPLSYTDKDEYTKRLLSDMQKQVDVALKNGIDRSNIILDPGVGFAKDLTENIWSIPATSLIKEMGYPVLLGISNKSVIGKTLDVDTSERLEGTISLNVMGLMYGCSIFRVHEVRANKRALDMAFSVLTR